MEGIAFASQDSSLITWYFILRFQTVSQIIRVVKPGWGKTWRGAREISSVWKCCRRWSILCACCTLRWQRHVILLFCSSCLSEYELLWGCSHRVFLVVWKFLLSLKGKPIRKNKNVSPLQNKFSSRTIGFSLIDSKSPLSHAVVERWAGIFAKLTSFWYHSTWGYWLKLFLGSKHGLLSFFLYFHTIKNLEQNYDILLVNYEV